MKKHIKRFAEKVRDLGSAYKKRTLTVVLDAGHGGINPETGKYVTKGKRSLKKVDGEMYYEGKENREFVLMFAEKLRLLGFTVEYTVNPDDHYDMPLGERIDIANEIHSVKPCVLIPVHSNGHSNSDAHGHEVFTSKGQTSSDIMASMWVKHFIEQFPDVKVRKDNTDGDPDKEANFALLTKTTCPALYLELLFHTNDKDTRMLRSDKFREGVTEVLAKTMLEFDEWYKNK